MQAKIVSGAMAGLGMWQLLLIPKPSREIHLTVFIAHIKNSVAALWLVMGFSSSWSPSSTIQIRIYVLVTFHDGVCNWSSIDHLWWYVEVYL